MRAGAVIEITTSSKEGAMLLLPNGASRCNVRPLKIFQEYAIKHAHHWYSFVNGNLCRMVENGALYLVTGCDKTTSWGVASFENRSGDCHMSLKLTAVQCGSKDISYAWKWEGRSLLSAESGPERKQGEEDWTNDQTVFLRGYKVAIRLRPLAALVEHFQRISKVRKIPSNSYDRISRHLL